MPDKNIISQVHLFITNIGWAKSAAKTGASVSHIAPRELIPRADADLGFDGALISYMSARGGVNTFEEIPEMTDQEWESFINRRIPPGCYWYRFFGQSPSAVYSVVAVTEEPL